MKERGLVFLIALVSEIFAIRWRWESAPTDQLRAWHEDSFKAYLIDSITPWLIIFSVLLAIWLVISRKQAARLRVTGT